MAISREELFEQVWAEPMLAVAERHRVSSSYLARVCACLNVPRPPRGYWAKVKFGQIPKKPALPPAKPGDETVWSPGTAPGAYGIRRSTRTRPPQPELPSDVGIDEAKKHGLLMGLREYYDNARVSDEGYLRPHKRLLPDIYVCKDALPRALETANELFLALERAGHRVMFAIGPAHRPELDQREKPGRFPLWRTWRPARPTVVIVDRVSFTLTLYEISESVEMRYVDGKYVRADACVPPKRHRYLDNSWTTTRDAPSGRLALRACSSDWHTKWEMVWKESKPGELTSKIRTIRRELRAAVPTIVAGLEEARRLAEIQRQRWEAECRAREQQERAERRAKAVKESRQQLLQLVEEWALARRIETFFEDAGRRSAEGPDESREVLTARLARARDLLGGTDTLKWFAFWKTPEERYSDETNEARSDAGL